MIIITNTGNNSSTNDVMNHDIRGNIAQTKHKAARIVQEKEKKKHNERKQYK